MEKQKEIGRATFLKLLKTIPYEDKKHRNEIVCGIIGHSKICDTFFGYRNCGRCGAQLGDNLGGMDFGAKSCVIIGHRCKECRKNYKTCTWKDKMFVKNPFLKRK
jgi:hypothetical protein